MKRLPLLLNLIVLCLSAAIAVTLQARRLGQALSTTSDNPRPAVQQEAVQLSALRQLPGLGFDNLIADWTFLRFLQYFGDEPARRQTGYELSGDYFDIIVGRDPHFLLAYLFVSTSTSMYAAEPERSVRIFSHGLESLSPETDPEGYIVWRYKAIDQLLFLGDRQGAETSFTQAADWAERFPAGRAIADLSRGTAQFLREDRNVRAAQVSAWGMVLSQAVDQRTTKIAVQRITELGGRINREPNGAYSISLPRSAP